MDEEAEPDTIECEGNNLTPSDLSNKMETSDDELVTQNSSTKEIMEEPESDLKSHVVLENKTYLKTFDRFSCKRPIIRPSLPKEGRLQLHKITNISFTRDKIPDPPFTFKENKCDNGEQQQPTTPPAISNVVANQSLLLRLFESKLFDMSMAVSYLYKCKEPGVQQYIGNKLFSLPKKDAYFYLPQLVNMYIQTFEVAEVLHPFLSNHCRNDSVFALHCAWLLDTFSEESVHHRKKSHGTKFRNFILSDQLR